MPSTNELIITFFVNNWILLTLLAIFMTGCVWKTVPRKWIHDNDISEKKVPFVEFVFSNFINTFLSTIVSHMLAAFGLTNMVSCLIFLVVIFDVFIRHQISSQAVALVSVGIVALYMSKLVDTGKTIKFLGVFSWERRDS